VHLDAKSVFPIPGDGRARSFLVKNISFESLTQTDLFARGWHKSGYLFGIDGVDTDGWVDYHMALALPATSKFKEAIVDVIRFPTRRDLPLEVSVNGGPSKDTTMELETVEHIKIPLSRSGETTVELRANQSFPLGVADARSRSFRVVNIDFD
jgi:hypothetical protein